MGKEAISKIREALGEDTSKVETFLKAIESDYSKFEVDLSDATETIKHVNTESKGRKLKIRELEGNLEDKESEIELLKKSDKSEEVEGLRAKLKTFEDAEAEKVKAKGEAFIAKFDKLKDHADWDKAKDKFLVPKEEDGKYDWTKLDINEVAKNADKLAEYQSLGHFDIANPKSEDRSSHRSKGDVYDPYEGQFED
jgi:chromosome segregation ATPase